MQGKTDVLDVQARYLKGVGPRKGELLLKLGISTVKDLIYYLPFRYEDRSSFTPIKELKAGERRTVKGDVVTTSTIRTRRGAPLFQMVVSDGSGFVNAVWFNMPFLGKVFKTGQKVVLYGKAERYDRLQMNQPEYEVLEEEEVDSIHIGRIVPIYSLTNQITQRYLRSLIHGAVEKYAYSVVDVLPTNMRAHERLVDIRFALRSIHFPATFEALKRAYRRIVFEEFFLLQLAFAIKKRSRAEEARGIRHTLEGGLMQTFMARLPFELTKGQTDAIALIGRDMASPKPMHRLLEGDVGSGKTVVAAYGLALTVQNGLQGALMAPTEVLASQHYSILSAFFMPLGVNVALLAGGIPPDEKQRILREIREGAVNIVIGTHAVIQEGVEFKGLGLVVIDEQHKFGVAQRAALRQKGADPHVLIMTATPIPRTLALTVYGDLDISVIRELPKGRRPIATYWVDEERRQSVYGFLKEEIGRGRQIYIVYPLIEESVKGGAKSAAEMYDKLSRTVFSGHRLGLLHGRMGMKEKERVMSEFKKGNTDILVATVVIEVGIDVPNASVMVIENAERFGLAQLHQLRGRIGRGQYASYCILLADPKTELARSRLKAIEDSVDGFEIAEEDLNLRGPGEFFGTSQHGMPEVRFGNIIKDAPVMEAARKAAFDLIARDPDLSREQDRPLREALASRFREKTDFVKTG